MLNSKYLKKISNREAIKKHFQNIWLIKILVSVSILQNPSLKNYQFLQFQKCNSLYYNNLEKFHIGK